MRPVWPKCSTPRGSVRWPATLPSHDSVAGWPSITVTIPQCAGNAPIKHSTCERAARLPRAGVLRGRPAGVQQIGRGHRQHADAAPSLADHPGRTDRLVCHRALTGDHHLAIRPRRARPIGPIDGALAERVIGALSGLFQRLGAQAQVDRAAGLVAQPGPLVRVAFAIPLKVIEGPFHDHRQFVGKGRFEGRQPILRQPREWRADRLVRAALGRQRHVRGRAPALDGIGQKNRSGGRGRRRRTPRPWSPHNCYRGFPSARQARNRCAGRSAPPPRPGRPDRPSAAGARPRRPGR